MMRHSQIVAIVFYIAFLSMACDDKVSVKDDLHADMHP